MEKRNDRAPGSGGVGIWHGAGHLDMAVDAMSRENDPDPTFAIVVLRGERRVHRRPVPGAETDADRHVIDLLPLSWLKESAR
jgi:hypothetical protein